VIVPTRDSAEFLSAAVESVLAQTDGDLELLVVDAGSDDETVEVALAVGDPRMRVIPLERGSLVTARNEGIHRARGRVVSFLDPEDVWLPEKVALETAVFERRPDVGMTYGNLGIVGRDGSILRSGRSALSRKPSGAILSALLTGNVVGPCSTVAVRRELVRGASAIRFDESRRYLEDWHFYLRVAARVHVGFVGSTLAHLRRAEPPTTDEQARFRERGEATVRFALELGRELLGLDEPTFQRLERRALGNLDACEARRRVASGDLEEARRLAVRSLKQHPWNVGSAALAALSSVGWVPDFVTRRMK